ncbi:MAG TPA: 8-amino-7-oxononanoate synthase [Thiotrichaceae bacterium]|nr:8-amino-7-oxononanoate synthase [Thiotrichaceae bacterium]
MNLAEEINQRKSSGLYRERKIINSAQGALIEIEGQQYINFSSNDYLGFANNAELKDCMIAAIDKYGVGAASSQLIVGHLTPHKLLEEKLSQFLDRDAALIFPTGYQANLAIASVLIDSNTVVLQDKLNHASLIDSALLSKGKLVRYRHNDVENLKTLLEKNKKYNLVVMTDGVFSMDGDYALLREIAELSKKYNALLIVDDAHGLGVLGERGAGLLEVLNLDQQQVPIIIGTFGKSFGASGAFVSGSKLHIEAFIQKARTYIYTTALLPSIAATMTRAIDLVSEGDYLRKNIKDLVLHYKNQTAGSGLNIGESMSHIQPLIIGKAAQALAASKELYENKILVTAIRPPTVPKNTSRLRISITAKHTKDQIDLLVETLKTVVSIKD